MSVAGVVTNRIGSDRVCRLSAISYGTMLPAIVLAPTLVAFIPALFCFGASHAALDVAMNTQAVAVEKCYQEPIMSSFHALWSTGGLVGAATGGLLAAQGLKPVAHISLVASLLGAVAMVAVPRLLDARELEAGRSRKSNSDKSRAGVQSLKSENPSEGRDPSPWPSPLLKGRGGIVLSLSAIGDSWA